MGGGKSRQGRREDISAIKKEGYLYGGARRLWDAAKVNGNGSGQVGSADHRNATALFLFSSPCITFWRIIKKDSTEDFSGVPYSMALLNCLLAAWYGLPFVSTNNTLVWTINGTGALLEAIFVGIFLIYAPRKVKNQMSGLLAAVLSVFAIVAFTSILAVHGQARKILCGCGTAIFSICMYASPLSIMRLVVKTKSVEFMPFFLSLFSFMCATSWFIYGLLGNDPFIYVPNGCGCALGIAQLILYAIYRKNKGQKAAGIIAPSKGASVQAVVVKHSSRDVQNNDKEMSDEHSVNVPV